MALYNGSEKVSSQISTAQYADVTDLMKHMTIEVGDVGQVMLPLNEGENKRRYLNGQIILQEQFKKFTEKLKKAVALYPSLACTEAEWQSLRKADPDDQCGKFVIDNVNGTIRLPRIKYLVGNLNLYKMADGLPNRRLVKKYVNGVNWYNLYSDGWLEQGGRGDTNNNTVTVTLHLEYKDTNYSVCIGCNTNGSYGSPSSCNITGVKTFQLRCGVATNWMWQTNGYASVPDTMQQYSNTLKSAFESPYYIQVSTGVDCEIDVTNKITNNNPYAFGMIQRSNAKLNNISWLESNGEFHSGNTYAEYYEWLLKKYNTPIDDITVRLNTDSDITEYDYVIDIENRTFKLPTLLGDETLDNHANSVNPGFPRPRSDTTYTYTTPYNGTLYVCINRGNTTGYTPSLYVNGAQYFAEPYWIANCTSWTVHLKRGDKVLIKCSDSGLTTDTFSFIQQRFIKAESGYKHLYFYVGEAEKNLDLINVGNMAENFVTVSSKLDEISTASEYITDVETQVNEMSTTVSTFDERMTNVDNHLVGLTETVEGMADVQTQMGEIALQMEEVTVKMEEVNTVADNINQFTKRYVIDTFHDGLNWYTLYNDGWCEQGGLNNTTGSGTLATVTLLKPYRDTNYFVARTNLNGTGNGPYANFTGGIQSRTEVGFTFIVDTAGTYCNGTLWEAKGYTTLPTEQEPTDTPTEE